jgi:hypothetical protein
MLVLKAWNIFQAAAFGTAFMSEAEVLLFAASLA